MADEFKVRVHCSDCAHTNYVILKEEILGKTLLVKCRGRTKRDHPCPNKLRVKMPATMPLDGSKSTLTDREEKRQAGERRNKTFEDIFKDSGLGPDFPFGRRT